MNRWAAMGSVALAAAFMAPPATAGSCDALDPLPVGPMLGRPYPGAGQPAAIRFVNMRPDPVRILWIDTAGVPRSYQSLPPGGEYVQPTFVSHRWLIESWSGEPVEGFIATRATTAGAPTQIAIIR